MDCPKCAKYDECIRKMVSDDKIFFVIRKYMYASDEVYQTAVKNALGCIS